jgi:hypothetical protein
MELWTGLAALKRDPKCKNFRRFGKGKGAYVNVVAWAESSKEFEQKVRNIAQRDLDCILCELEKIDLLEARMQSDDFPAELITMRATAYRQREDTVFGTFHTWLQDERN